MIKNAIIKLFKALLPVIKENSGAIIEFLITSIKELFKQKTDNQIKRLEEEIEQLKLKIHSYEEQITSEAERLKELLNQLNEKETFTKDQFELIKEYQIKIAVMEAQQKCYQEFMENLKSKVTDAQEEKTVLDKELNKKKDEAYSINNKSIENISSNPILNKNLLK